MKKGFTLIELLAVIVILAIIALIAVPIIVNIIDNAEEESEIRSAELYIDAVDKSVLAYNMSNKLKNAICTVQSDGNLNCDGTIIEVDVKNTKATAGTITIENRRVTKVENLKVGDHYYSTNTSGKLVLVDSDSSCVLAMVSSSEVEPVTCDFSAQVYEPHYYYNGYNEYSIGDTLLSEAVTTQPEIDNYYLGYDVNSNNKIIAAYVCFKIGASKKCLKGGDVSAYNSNLIALANAFGKERCSINNGRFSCSYKQLGIMAYAQTNGEVFAGSLGIEQPEEAPYYKVTSDGISYFGL